jgi:hypothetical protein
MPRLTAEARFQAAFVRPPKGGGADIVSPRPPPTPSIEQCRRFRDNQRGSQGLTVSTYRHPAAYTPRWALDLRSSPDGSGICYSSHTAGDQYPRRAMGNYCCDLFIIDGSTAGLPSTSSPTMICTRSSTSSGHRVLLTAVIRNRLLNADALDG